MENYISEMNRQLAVDYVNAMGEVHKHVREQLPTVEGINFQIYKYKMTIKPSVYLNGYFAIYDEKLKEINWNDIVKTVTSQTPIGSPIDYRAVKGIKKLFQTCLEKNVLVGGKVYLDDKYLLISNHYGIPVLAKCDELGIYTRINPDQVIVNEIHQKINEMNKKDTLE